MSTSTGQPSGRPLRAARAALPVLSVVLSLVALAVALWSLPLTRLTPAALLGAGRLAGAPNWTLPWWAIAVLTAACELIVLHIQLRREAHAVSLSEITIVLGLLFASPGAFLLGRAVGAAAVFVLYRRQTLMKVLFNNALYTAESCTALLVIHAIRGSDPTLGPRAWLAAYAATIAVGTLASVAVTVVIGLTDRELSGSELLIEVVRGAALSAAVATIGLVAAQALHDDLRIAVLLLPTLALLVAGYRAYSSLSEQHLSLERLYRFSHVVSSKPEVDTIIAEVLTHARQVLRADRAQIAFLPADPAESPVHIDVDENGILRRRRLGPVELTHCGWGQALGGASALLQREDSDAGQRAFLAQTGLRDAVLAPLRSDTGIVGAILVGDRMGEVRTFDKADVRLLETVANHASMALQNGQLIDRLRYDARHDSLTGLSNRAVLQDSLGAQLELLAAGRTGGFAAMLLDLNGFKQVNDTYGHSHGDELLCEMARRLEYSAPDGAVVARLGGDEFAVLLPGIDEVDAAVCAARTILIALEQPVSVGGMELEIGGSIGIALAPLHGIEASVLLKRADEAMYQAKAAGRGLHVHDGHQDGDSAGNGPSLVGELRAGIAAGQLELHVQPQADLQTGLITGAEALIRWQHPTHGLLYPDAFIKMAERSGLIRPLTTAMLTASIRACAQWGQTGHNVGISVNLSARSLLDFDIVKEVEDLLMQYGLPAGRLTLEITESSIISDPRRTIAVLHALEDMGVRLSVDDFGTGYSSLSYLKELPLHELKIDRSFVTSLGQTGEDDTLTRTIIDLGRNFSLDVVAEGVETQAAADALRIMGASTYQGYLLSRPMPAAHFQEWLDQYARRHRPPAPWAITPLRVVTG